jgi:hypothetical protein
MSALGSLLLQPQALMRAQKITDHKALADELLALLQQLAFNPSQAQALAPAFSTAFTQCATQLRQQIEPKLQSALTEVNTLLAPLMTHVNQLVTQAGTLHTVGDALDLVSTSLDGVLALIQALSQQELADISARITHLLETTLGFNQNLVHDLIRQILGTIRQQLLAGTQVMSEDTAAVRFACVALIGRLEREVLADLPVLPLDKQRIAQTLMGALLTSGFEKIRAKAQTLLEQIRAVLGATTALIDLAKPAVFGPGSGGAAEVRAPLSGDTYCWYATWLLQTSHRSTAGKVADALLPGYPGDEVWISADKTQLILRRALNPDEVLYENPAGNVRWTDAPMFNTNSAAECFTFKPISADALETWTQLSWALATGVKALCHIIQSATSPKEYGTNVPMTLWHTSNMLSASLAQAPLPSYLTKAAGFGLGSQWMYVLVPMLSVGLGSLEGIHTKTNGTNKFLQWITLLGGDVLNAYTFSAVPDTAYNAILSALTLINYDGPSSPTDGPDLRPKNREYFTTFVSLWVTAANYLMLKLVPRSHYGLPAPIIPGSNWFYAWWAVSIGTGVVGGMLGTFTGWAFSRSVDWASFGEQIGMGVLKSVATFVVQWYNFKEGDTNDGKYNPKGDDFKGYPKAEHSPYKLPYPKGTSLFVGQANQGLFSHMAFNATPQVYAYDFAHDFGDDIVACRAGTVVDYFDWIVDDINPGQTEMLAAQTAATSDLSPTQTNWTSWNFIIVHHGTALDDHDLDVGGVKAETYAVYGHGQQGSVRAAFAASGVADPKTIIGQPVQQGQVIMKAGDVGMSFHNHLHLHVQVLDTSPAKVGLPVAQQLKEYTIPFVFQEARHILGTDGVLKRLNWYTSDNEVL